MRMALPGLVPVPRAAVPRSTKVAAPVAKFEGALAETATGNDGDSVGGATVNFYKGDQSLAIFAARIFDAERGEPEHRQTHAEHLTGTEMAVGDFSFAEVLVEGEHLGKHFVIWQFCNLVI